MIFQKFEYYRLSLGHEMIFNINLHIPKSQNVTEWNINEVIFAWNCSVIMMAYTLSLKRKTPWKVVFLLRKSVE